MGPYCAFCDRRCFLLRRIPNQGPMEWLLATCAAGREHDRKVLGFDVDSAINPREESTEG